MVEHIIRRLFPKGRLLRCHALLPCSQETKEVEFLCSSSIVRRAPWPAFILMMVASSAVCFI